MGTCNAEVTRMAAPQPGVGAQASLFDRFGGRPGIESLVDRFLDQMGSDRKMASRLAQVDMASMRKGLEAFFAEAFGGRRAAPGVEAPDTRVNLDGEEFLRVTLMLHETISNMGLEEELQVDVELAIFSHALSRVP